ncbi:regulatory protein SipA [Chamaesiphon sp.]|uniref:regulatory protein SipA n=1 Tax=Chamaesiphon sp. TaxID=2814140 RepID=UPI0035931BA3
MSQEFNIGATVRITALPTYLKTAEPMPMLLSPSRLELGAIGLITDRKPGNYWVVKFDRSSFLIEDRYLEVVDR